MVRRENVEKGSSIQDGEYEYMTSFMEYAIDRGLVFRDWMLDINRYNPVNCEEENIAIGRKRALLSITVYSGNGLDICLEYFADREKLVNGKTLYDEYSDEPFDIKESYNWPIVRGYQVQRKRRIKCLKRIIFSVE